MLPCALTLCSAFHSLCQVYKEEGKIENNMENKNINEKSNDIAIDTSTPQSSSMQSCLP